MKLVMAAILGALLIFLIVQMWYFYERGEVAGEDLERLTASLQKAKEEQEVLRADHEFYQNPANMEKELRARFNYRAPDETMIVIVEKSTSTASSTP
jgi:cell division protein FtsB